MRYVVVGLGLLAAVGGLMSVKALQFGSLTAMGEEMAAAGPPPETVGSAVAQRQLWEGMVATVGSIAGVRSVALSNDAAGRVVSIHFESGATVARGQALVVLDSNVERAQLAAAKSRRDLALINAKRARFLVENQAVAPADRDNAEAELAMAMADQAALSAEIDRKIVRAPFSGRLGIRDVNVGQYLSPGTPLTTLEALGDVYVDFALPQQELGTVSEGMLVRVALAGSAASPIEGLISAVDPSVDDATRSLKLRASVPNQKGTLRPGMFVNVSVVTLTPVEVVAVPATAIVHASYGDSVFVIEEKSPGAPGMHTTPDGETVRVVRQQFVRVGEMRGDFVAIVEGIDAGDVVVSAGAFKLRNGAPVVVDNSVQAEPQEDPQPPNR